MIEILSNKVYLYIGIIIIANIIFIHIKIKMLMIKKSKEFDKKINATINIFKSSTDINDIFNILLKNLYEISAYDAAISILKDDNDFKLFLSRLRENLFPELEKDSLDGHLQGD